MPETEALRCWLVLDEGTMEDALLIFEYSRGQAIQRFADEHDMLFWECVSKGSQVRTRRQPHLDGYKDTPGEIVESGPYLLAGCYTLCAGCENEICRDRYACFEPAVILNWTGFCPECAARRVTGGEDASCWKAS